MNPLKNVNPEKLKRLFKYNPITGEITRRVTTSSNAVAGAIVGTLDGKGYLHVSVEKKFILLHHLAWFLHYGVPCDAEIDHADRRKTNNSIRNLRKACRREQAGNIAPPKHNTSGVKGVYKNRRGKYVAQIKIHGKQTYLGSFPEIEQARIAYKAAAEKHFGDFCHVV